jgi:hypothetical protein
MKILFNRFVLLFADVFLVPMFKLFRYSSLRAFGNDIQRECYNRSISDSADYADNKMMSAMMFNKREQLWDFSLSKIQTDGLFGEFGVFEGYSINYFANKFPNHSFHGFDSFEGLQEDWSGWILTKGSFDLGGVLPKVKKNVHLHKGWFDETLPIFLQSNQENFSFIHIDCDTYEATKSVFLYLNSRIVEGTIIVFDEYFGYRGWRLGEYKAWQEFVSSYSIIYDYIGFSSDQVSLVVKSRNF